MPERTRRLIKSIKIHRFRSFGDEMIEADLLNIYSGKNNVGKSNILKALNLFFNGKTDYDSPYLHSRDYNKAFRGASGGKREVTIEITFLPTGNGALRKEFGVTKKYYDDRSVPIVEHKSTDPEIEAEIRRGNGHVTRQFTAYLNKIEYLYVPAVRDKNLIRKILLNFEQIIKSEASGDDFSNSMSGLSSILTEASSGISDDFEKYIGIPAKATLSTSVADVLGATKIDVMSGLQVKAKRSRSGPGEIKDVPVDLFSSGDGVVMAYLVYFLSYLTRKNRKNFIWGYEEPENSLEYSKVQMLAEEFYEKFTKDAQIFVTTHSPAFIDLRKRTGVLFYRVFQRPLSEADRAERLPDRKLTYVQTLDNIRHQLRLFDDDNPVFVALENELHMVEQANEIQKIADEVKKENCRLREEMSKMRRLFKTSNKIVIATEGNNIDHIKHAITILAPDLLGEIEFLEGLKDGSGVDTLKKMFEYESAKEAGKALFVFDCDALSKVESLEEKNGTFVYVFDKKEDSAVNGGIENLYPKEFFEDGDFSIKEVQLNDGEKTERRLRKKEFCERILQLHDNNGHQFDSFEGLISKIREILMS